ncbi:MAG: HipA domain-containing protein [Alphaproteobacteria bacterium]
MAKLLWGKVNYQDRFAGIIREEPGHAISFTYDDSYLNGKNPPISHTLPLTGIPFVSQVGLLPFFDNLVSEGWLEDEQKRLLNRQASRFELLLAFGYDCAGAVSILDPEPAVLRQTAIDLTDQKELAVMKSRASLSGVQPKLALIERNGKFFPTRIGELSTHIGKFPSEKHIDLTHNEHLTMAAFKTLLPEDTVAELHLGPVEGITEQALIIKRFDRTPSGARLHFEEFNQLLGRISRNKYEADYQQMANFINETPGCLNVEKYRLFLRILAGLLLGNTDMHLKNFAMFHTDAGLRLTPSYDQVSAIIYGYKNIALGMNGAKDLLLGNLKMNSILRMGEGFQLNKDAIHTAINHLEHHKEAAKQAIADTSIKNAHLKNQIINTMETRWNETFASIGKL